jgi:hypothetical protein
MLSPRYQIRRFLLTTLHVFCAVVLLAGCQENPLAGVRVTTDQGEPPAASYPQGEITFEAQVPAELKEGQNLYIEFLDEVTGLALNASRTRMQPDESTGDPGRNFSAKTSFAVGSVIKYRYMRDNEPVGIEYNSLGQQVRYRLYQVDGPGTVRDTIAAWKTRPATSDKLGRIEGQVAIKSSNAPVINALITAGGMHTLSASDGTFILEGLPEGIHNLVVYSLDGAFRPFQQGAIVGANATTPAPVFVVPNQTVSVTFMVTPPEDNQAGVPIRFIGNIYSLGNTFADLSGGANVLASRAPLMALQPDGRYAITLKLPAGLDLRYKYTLGDGFWNAERANSGHIRLRQLIVPNKDVTVEDHVETWKTSGFSPVTFTVTVPPNTPITDTVSIQFNPYGWTEPIPMWPLGNNRWFYILYNPLNAFSTASYRYCRNDQCGVADDQESRGFAAVGRPFAPKDSPVDMKDTVTSWAWMDPASEQIIVSAALIGRRENFSAGMAFLPEYRPAWQPYMVWAFKNQKDIGANTSLITPTWRLTHKDPPIMEPVPGQDPLWSDLTQSMVQAQHMGLSVMLHPVLAYNEDADTWWESSTRDDNWWQSWFSRYRTFILHHADLAAQTGVKTLILGDERLQPALPGGTLASGAPSGIPEDVEERWSTLIAEVRGRYPGELAWMIPYSGSLPEPPPFLDQFDLLYIQLDPPFGTNDQPTQLELEAGIKNALDGEIYELQQQSGLPVLLGLRYPAVSGAADGCIESGENCLSSGDFMRPVPEFGQAERSLKEQADAYSAALTAVNQRPWITGFFAVGYYPPAELKDMSTSVRGKPAADVLWYWFPRLLGTAAP